MKNLFKILILSLFITSCGENLIEEVKERYDNGKFKVGFSLYPVKVSQMKQIADDGLKMPPKTTYIEPKLKSGLTIYEF